MVKISHLVRIRGHCQAQILVDICAVNRGRRKVIDGITCYNVCRRLACLLSVRHISYMLKFRLLMLTTHGSDVVGLAKVFPFTALCE